MSYLIEAFKALNALDEDVFSVSDDGIEKLSAFEDDDTVSDDITIYDVDAENESELEDSYIGKIILDCNVCHSKLYKDKADVVIDEESNDANIDMECPYCYSVDGFKIIGEVAPMTTETEETEDDAELDESLKESVEPSAIDRVQNLLDIIDKSFEVEDDTFMNEAILDEDKNIRLTSIPGVTRNREEDFTDDGNRFQAYLYKDLIPITYLRADGEVYITIAFHHLDGINYKEYKEFPSYMHADDFNGVSVEDFDPQVFKKNLDAAYNDVTVFLGNVKEVDPQQLEDRIKVINNACKEYEEKVKQYIKDNALDIMKLSAGGFSRLKGYVTSAGTRTADAIRDASASFQRDFMSNDIEKLKENISNSWNFKYIEEIINSVKESCNEELKDSEVAESVDLATKENTVAGVLAKHMLELYAITDVNELRKAVIDIVDNSDIADKAIVSKLRRDLFSKKSVGALLSTIATYMTGTKVAKVGRKNEAVEDTQEESSEDTLGTDLDKYQKWVDYDMKKYHKISNKTNSEIRKAGLQIVKDKYGAYQVTAGKYEESLKESLNLNEAKNIINVLNKNLRVRFKHSAGGIFSLDRTPFNEDTFNKLIKNNYKMIGDILEEQGLKYDISEDAYISKDENLYVTIYGDTGTVIVQFDEMESESLNESNNAVYDMYKNQYKNLLQDIKYVLNSDNIEDIRAYDKESQGEYILSKLFDSRMNKQNMSFEDAKEDVIDFLYRTRADAKSELELRNKRSLESKSIMNKVKSELSKDYKLVSESEDTLYFKAPGNSTHDDCIAFVDKVVAVSGGKYTSTGRGGSWTLWDILTPGGSYIKAGYDYSNKDNYAVYFKSILTESRSTRSTSKESVKDTLKESVNSDIVSTIKKQFPKSTIKTSVRKHSDVHKSNPDTPTGKTKYVDIRITPDEESSVNAILQYCNHNIKKVLDSDNRFYYYGDVPARNPRGGKEVVLSYLDYSDLSDDEYDSLQGESLKECVKDVTITTDDSRTTMTSEDDGKVTVTTEPVEKDEKEAEVLAPVSDETEMEIEENSAEDMDAEIDDIDSDSFEESLSSVLKEQYDNVKSYKMSSCSFGNNDVVTVNGIIEFASGKKGNAQIKLESHTIDKKGNTTFLTESSKLFSTRYLVSGNLKEKKFITESIKSKEDK